jgi:hypothetical protein
MTKRTDSILEKRFLTAVYNEALRRNPKKPLSEWFDLSIEHYIHPSNFKFIAKEVDPKMHQILEANGIKYLRIKPILVVLKQKGYIECETLYYDKFKFKLTSAGVVIVKNTDPIIQEVKPKRTKKKVEL